MEDSLPPSTRMSVSYRGNEQRFGSSWRSGVRLSNRSIVKECRYVKMTWPRGSVLGIYCISRVPGDKWIRDWETEYLALNCEGGREGERNFRRMDSVAVEEVLFFCVKTVSLCWGAAAARRVPPSNYLFREPGTDSECHLIGDRWIHCSCWGFMAWSISAFEAHIQRGWMDGVSSRKLIVYWGEGSGGALSR